MKSALLKLIIGLVLLTVLIMTSKLESNLVEAQEPCYPPLSLARTNGASWPRGTNVTVFIDPDGFSALENVAIRDAFINWQNSNRSRGNNSNVTFTFVSGALHLGNSIPSMFTEERQTGWATQTLPLLAI